MIGEWIDRALAVISPEAAVRRTHARAIYSSLRERSYDAAKRNRLNADWRVSNRSADSELLADGDYIRARARDLARNNPYARGAIRALVRNIVGDGIMPQAAVKSGDESADAVNPKLENLFDRWQRRAEISGVRSFYETQRQVVAEVSEAGECLARFVESDDPQRVLPLSIELIEADRLASDATFPAGKNAENGNEIRRGVEIDRNGKPVAYWLYSGHPQDSLRSQTPERHDAANFLHLFRPTRIGQTRGVSAFAPVVLWLRNLDSYLGNELVASRINSCFGVAIKSTGGGNGAGILQSTDGQTEDAKGNPLEHLEPGLVARLYPDESIEVINPGRSHSDASPWIDLLLRTVSVGAGLSYERLTRDYSKTNYSSNRASDLEDRREFRIEQQYLIETLCHETWIRFIASAVASGKFDWLPDAEEFIRDFENWTAVSWHPPGWEWVDPQKESKASEIALDNNLSTLRDEIGKRGGDWRDVLKQRALEMKTLAALLGVEVSSLQPTRTPERPDKEKPSDG